MRARTRHINLEWIFIMKSLLALAITAMSLSAANAATVYNKDGSEVLWSCAINLLFSRFR